MNVDLPWHPRLDPTTTGPVENLHASHFPDAGACKEDSTPAGGFGEVGVEHLHHLPLHDQRLQNAAAWEDERHDQGRISSDPRLHDDEYLRQTTPGELEPGPPSPEWHLIALGLVDARRKGHLTFYGIRVNETSDGRDEEWD